MWTYVVAGRDRVRRVMVCSRLFTTVVSLSFVGDVSPSMFNTVPKCFEYGGVSKLFAGVDECLTWVVIVVSTGH